MCGRTCLTLDPNQILCACKYKNSRSQQQKSAQTTTDLKDIKQNTNIAKDSINLAGTVRKPVDKDLDEVKVKVEKTENEIKSEFLIPEWHEVSNLDRKYAPSYNIAPTDITPVLVSTEYFVKNEVKQEQNKTEEDEETNTLTLQTQTQTRVVVPMMWGMIPFWHKGDYRKHGLTTNNCRLEHMLESKLYRGPFKRGQRCVVLCEGFYEWQTTKSTKPSERAAYLIHMPQAEHIKIYDKCSWTSDNINLLKMAGIFDVWKDENDEKMYSYSVITFESTKIMSWLHHRMPAILETEEQVNNWLDFKRVTDEQALAALRPATELKWHQVSNIVNNSRNKSEQCNKPLEQTKQKRRQIVETPMNKTMLSWLNIRKKREIEANIAHSDDDSGDDDNKNAQNAAEQPAKRQRFIDFKATKFSDSASASDK